MKVDASMPVNPRPRSDARKIAKMTVRREASTGFFTAWIMVSGVLFLIVYVLRNRQAKDRNDRLLELVF